MIAYVRIACCLHSFCSEAFSESKMNDDNDITADKNPLVHEKFKLDRTRIQTAVLVDDNDEINQLGLSIFNQADLEQGRSNDIAVY
jgi:acetylglutamate synthase